MRLARNGLSLLEVIVAAAILGLAMAAIGNFVHLGSMSASQSKWISEAQILCDTKMAEISAGVLPLQNNGGSTVLEDPNWMYTVEVQSSNIDGLLSVTVTVQRAGGSGNLMPVTLMRLMPDPDYEPEISIIQ
ncbi:MAG: prepilin-type N-terminal cleavage/methylation domain-containing protein [Pirellulaceae bacterium]